MLLLITYWQTMMLYCLWLIEQQLTLTHAHRILQNSEETLQDTILCFALTRLWMSHMPELNDRERLKVGKALKSKLCMYFPLHSFYFLLKLYKHFIFTLLLQKCCFPASVRWCCLKSHNYVLKQQTCTDTQPLPQTSMGVVNYFSEIADLWSNFSRLQKAIWQRHH